MLTATFLGTGAATPTVDRNVAGLAVQREGETILFDCGEGNQRQMMRYGVGFSFTEIFFTHYHADHILGVTGLLRTMGLQDRTAPVTLYGPRGAQRVLGAAISLGIERNKFPVEIIEVRPGDRLRREQYDIVVFETEHRPDTVGLRPGGAHPAGALQPRARPRAGRARGAALGPAAQGRDDRPRRRPQRRSGGPGGLAAARAHAGLQRRHPPAAWRVVEAARGADLLIHEATFGSDELERAKETGHSTAAEAARVAVEAGVRRLVLTHISPRYTREAPGAARGGAGDLSGDRRGARRADGGRAVCRE